MLEGGGNAELDAEFVSPMGLALANAFDLQRMQRIAVATGGKAMGAVECEQGDVLYLALEDNRRRVKDRLLTLCPARKLMKISLDRLTIRTLAPRIDTGLMVELDKWRLSCANSRPVSTSWPLCL